MSAATTSSICSSSRRRHPNSSLTRTSAAAPRPFSVADARLEQLGQAGGHRSSAAAIEAPPGSCPARADRASVAREAALGVRDARPAGRRAAVDQARARRERGPGRLPAGAAARAPARGLRARRWPASAAPPLAARRQGSIASTTWAASGRARATRAARGARGRRWPTSRARARASLLAARRRTGVPGRRSRPTSAVSLGGRGAPPAPSAPAGSVHAVVTRGQSRLHHLMGPASTGALPRATAGQLAFGDASSPSAPPSTREASGPAASWLSAEGPPSSSAIGRPSTRWPERLRRASALAVRRPPTALRRPWRPWRRVCRIGCVADLPPPATSVPGMSPEPASKPPAIQLNRWTMPGRRARSQDHDAAAIRWQHAGRGCAARGGRAPCAKVVGERRALLLARARDGAGSVDEARGLRAAQPLRCRGGGEAAGHSAAQKLCES